MTKIIANYSLNELSEYKSITILIDSDIKDEAVLHNLAKYEISLIGVTDDKIKILGFMSVSN